MSWTASTLLKKPSNFGMHYPDDDMFRTWSLGPIVETRDSSTLERSNARVLKRALAGRPDFEDQWNIVHCGHWAVGWCDHLSFRAVDEDGETLTPIALFLHDWITGLEEDYPIADKSDWSELQYETASEYWSRMSLRDRIHACARLDVSIFAARRDEIPDDPRGEMISYLADGN